MSTPWALPFVAQAAPEQYFLCVLLGLWYVSEQYLREYQDPRLPSRALYRNEIEVFRLVGGYYSFISSEIIHHRALGV